MRLTLIALCTALLAASMPAAAMAGAGAAAGHSSSFHRLRLTDYERAGVDYSRKEGEAFSRHCAPNGQPCPYAVHVFQWTQGGWRKMALSVEHQSQDLVFWRFAPGWAWMRADDNSTGWVVVSTSDTIVFP